MKELIALIACLSVISCSTIALVGGYQDYKELDSADFKKVLELVKLNHHELVQLDPISVKRQIVNGYNNMMTFKLF